METERSLMGILWKSQRKNMETLSNSYGDIWVSGTPASCSGPRLVTGLGSGPETYALGPGLTPEPEAKALGPGQRPRLRAKV